MRPFAAAKLSDQKLARRKDHRTFPSQSILCIRFLARLCLLYSRPNLETVLGGSCTSAHRRLRYELLGGSDILNLVDLLHLGGLVGRALDFLKRGQVVVIAQALIVIVDAQAELDHAVDAASELGGLIEVKA